MLLASTFTFGDALLTVLEFALVFLWIWIAVGVIFDVFCAPTSPTGGRRSGCSSSSSCR